LKNRLIIKETLTDTDPRYTVEEAATGVVYVRTDNKAVAEYVLQELQYDYNEEQRNAS
jgi:tRNA G46 methylase TrmB